MMINKGSISLGIFPVANSSDCQKNDREKLRPYWFKKYFNQPKAVTSVSYFISPLSPNKHHNKIYHKIY